MKPSRPLTPADDGDVRPPVASLDSPPGPTPRTLRDKLESIPNWPEHLSKAAPEYGMNPADVLTVLASMPADTIGMRMPRPACTIERDYDNTQSGGKASTKYVTYGEVTDEEAVRSAVEFTKLAPHVVPFLEQWQAIRDRFAPTSPEERRRRDAERKRKARAAIKAGAPKPPPASSLEGKIASTEAALQTSRAILAELKAVPRRFLQVDLLVARDTNIRLLETKLTNLKARLARQRKPGGGGDA